MYILIIFLPKYRMAAALGTAVLFMILGILPLQEAPGAVNWNALMMMGGTMIDYTIASVAESPLMDVFEHKVKTTKPAAVPEAGE